MAKFFKDNKYLLLMWTVIVMTVLVSLLVIMWEAHLLSAADTLKNILGYLIAFLGLPIYGYFSGYLASEALKAHWRRKDQVK